MNTNAVLVAVGWLTLLYYAIIVVRFFFVAFYTSPSSLLKRYRRSPNDTWAAVTGASDGIGFGFSQELAARGFNVILIGRNASKLQSKADEIQTINPTIQTKILVADATDPDPTTLITALRTIHPLNLTLLINNVGGIPPTPAPVSAPLPLLSLSRIDQLLNMNARFTIRITTLLLPHLSRNGPSLVLNISSLAQLGIPYITPYAGSKGFISSFSKSLARECAAERMNVAVFNLLVGDVRSANNADLVAAAESSLLRSMPSSRRYAEAVLDRAGLFGAWWGDGVEVTPFPAHKFAVAVARDLMPGWIFTRIVTAETWKNRVELDGWDGVTLLGDRIREGEGVGLLDELEGKGKGKGGGEEKKGETRADAEGDVVVVEEENSTPKGGYSLRRRRD